MSKLFTFITAFALTTSAVAGKPDAERGLRLLRTKAYLPPDFDQTVFDQLWRTWPDDLRKKAETATTQQRRKMTFNRYGLVEPPDGKGKGPALGYVDDGKRGWVMNCFTCHAGKVAGKTILGLPNTHLDLQSLTDDVRRTKTRLGKSLSHMELGSTRIPINSTVGTTNAVIFGVALGGLRDKDMNFVIRAPRSKHVHHDMDAPPWWNVRKKSMLYCDAFSPKNARVLMQFILLPQNDRKKILTWERDYEDILAYIETVKPPKYPWKVDKKLAEQGRVVFNANCARCHGTYGDKPSYPQKVIPLKTIGTDPVRHRALTKAHRERLQQSWMSRYGKDRVVVEPKGYLAPPLDGVWASAPYFHNGSVPTLWHVLHPSKRPRIWKRTSRDGYDRDRVGLPIKAFGKRPAGIRDRAERRRYFDTTKFGKSAAGHRFPETLTSDEKRAVLEYLKTL